MKKVNEFEYGVQKKQALVHRFSRNANLHYRYPSFEGKEGTLPFEDDIEKIREYVLHHMEEQRPRLDELERYYEGFNASILQKERRKEDFMADHRAVHNFAQYISTFIQGYMTGIPIKTEYVAMEDKDILDDEQRMEYARQESEMINEELQALNRINEADEHNSELVLDQSIFGRAYEFIYRNREDELKFAKLDPKHTFVVYDVSVDRDPVAGVRYLKDFNDDSIYNVYVYTERNVTEYRMDVRKQNRLVFVDRQPCYFGGVQINEYENNSKRQGDFESVLSLIDLYDSAQSDLANYSQDLNDAMLVIEGNVKMDISGAKDMKQANIMMLKPAIDPNGNVHPVRAYYIYKQYDVAGMEAYKTRVMNDIFLISNVPNLLDEKFSSNQSGEALKMKLFGLAQKRATKERKFKKALRNRYRLLRNNMFFASELDFDVESLQITFTENMPRAISNEIEWFSNLGGELSQETMLSLLSFVENPKEERGKIESEQKEESSITEMDFQSYLNEGGDEDADNEPE